MEQHLTWTIPAPFWKESIDFVSQAVRREFSRPTILRFTTDDFMSEMTRVAVNDPARLRLYEAVPETWQTPPPPITPPDVLPAAPGALAGARRKMLLKNQRSLDALTPERSAPPGPLKLYQPAHQRYYMVTSCLVCRVPGLPDHALASGGREKPAFVVRRLVNTNTDPKQAPDPDTATQYAFNGKSWDLVADPRTINPGEEQLPLSPLYYEAANARRRRLMIGLIPVAKREIYYNTPVSGVAQTGNPKLLDPRVSMLQSQVTSGWNSFYDTVTQLQRDLASDNVVDGHPEHDQQPAKNDVTVRITSASYFVLLELAKFLKNQIPDLFDAISNPSTASRNGLSSNETKAVYDAVTQYTYDGKILSEVLAELPGLEPSLDAILTTYTLTGPNTGWPSWKFPLVSVNEPDPLRSIPASLRGTNPSTATRLFDLIIAALPDTPATTLPPVRLAAQANTNPQEIVWFSIRCVVEQADCGPLAKPTVSAPTAAFQMAGFFDPDAPARPIRIGLPIDPTPAGLRRVDRNTAFVMSDMMACHFRRIQSMSFGDLVLSVLPFPFKKSLPNAGGNPCVESGVSLGLVCSLSIPIITICALILLIIIVKLLDIIFSWIPYFAFCFPIPSFKSKDS